VKRSVVRRVVAGQEVKWSVVRRVVVEQEVRRSVVGRCVVGRRWGRCGEASWDGQEMKAGQKVE